MNIKRIYKSDDLIDFVGISEYLWKHGHLTSFEAIRYVDINIEDKDDIHIHQIVLNNNRTFEESDITDWNDYDEWIQEIEDVLVVLDDKLSESSGSNGSISERSFY